MNSAIKQRQNQSTFIKTYSKFLYSLIFVNFKNLKEAVSMAERLMSI